MYKYFCDNCGEHFSSDTAHTDKYGMMDIFCPHCGAWDIYPDTLTGSADAVRHLTEYENATRDE